MSDVDSEKSKVITSEFAESVLNSVGMASRRMLQLVEPINVRYSLGPRGASMLTLIERGAIHPAQLAEIYEVGRSLITTEVARLIEAGLVSRNEFPEDKRRASLALTPLGREISAECFAAYVDVIQSSLGRYSYKKQVLFLTILEDLSGLIR